MSKYLVKIFENGKDLCSKKLDANDTLLEVRKKIKFENRKNVHFMNEKSPISIEDEKDITVGDILKNKNIYLEGDVIKLYLNNEFILDVDMNEEEPLKNLVEKYSKNIPLEFDFLDKDQRILKKEDVIADEDILIEDVLINNKINIISKEENIIKKEEPPENIIQKKKILN